MQSVISPFAWTLIVALSVLWGGSFFLNEIILRQFEPLWVVIFRVAVGALGLITYNLAAGHRMPRSIRTWRDLFVMGLINNVIPFGLICWGQTQIEGGVAAIINATTPLFTVLLASVWIKEALTTNRVVGVLTGLVGVVIMVGFAAMSGLLNEGFGQLAIVGAAISYSFASIWAKRRITNMPVSITAAGMLIASTVIMVPVGVATGLPDFADIETSTWLAIAGLGLACSAFAYLLYFKIIQLAGPTSVSLVTFLIPLSAVLLGMVFIGESLSAASWIGMALILLGLALVDGRILGKK